jgi:hypothetical protein
MEWIEEGLTGVSIFKKLQKQGLKAGNSTVKDYLAQIKICEKNKLKGYSGTKKELAKFMVDNLEISTLL